MIANAGCYSEGVRSGEIQKFSQKGVFNKSWEGEMVMEGLKVKSAGNGAAVTNVWRFSVTSQDVANKVNVAVFKGGKVSVKYCQALINNPLERNTSYEVIDVAVKSQ